ncbi:MAG TPA: GNAT family N-acetyltransferase [Candidatus Limnocylindrales bacterium]|nr:GNAT family N-acetyltransferase [Candidatus Limnocylindrales bacterium]
MIVDDKKNAAFRIRRVDILGEDDICGLADVTIDCVEGGASIGFLQPVSRENAHAFWHGLAAGVSRGEKILLVAEDTAGIVGTVTLIPATFENQPHRADVAKMQVHRRARRCGIGAALLAAVEREALEAGRTVLVLDTVTGSDAYRLYSRSGWQRCGEIPDYALWPDGRPCPTTIFFKSLRR